MSACSVCERTDIEIVNQALKDGGTMRELAARFSIPKSNLQRHKTGCLPRAAFLAAVETGGLLKEHPAEVTDSKAVVSELLTLKAMVATYLQAQTTNGKPLPLALVRELRQCLELLGKMTIAMGATRPPDPLTDNPVYAMLTQLTGQIRQEERDRSGQSGTSADQTPGRPAYQDEEEDTGVLIGSLDSERRDAETAEEIRHDAEMPSDDHAPVEQPTDAPTASQEATGPVVAGAIPRKAPLTPLEAHKLAMEEMSSQLAEQERWEDL